MKTLKKLLNINLSSVQLEKLYEVIDADGDGLISTAGKILCLLLSLSALVHPKTMMIPSCAEFLDAFQVVDITQDGRAKKAVRQQAVTNNPTT
jgi:Ca2+-binding EF-hand superfamily protein